MTEYKPFGRLTGAEACKLGYTPAVVTVNENGNLYLEGEDIACLPRKYGVVRYYPKGSY